ncbi:MAG TPA: hypothetical protein VNN77_19550 [candidate division Zixibacteria bacterium]|nr:hypothetical protein [candidate division Zixibacteria bacterium]
MLSSWLHVLALTIYFGSAVSLSALLLPALGALEDRNERALALATALRFYNPLHIGALGVALLTGAFELTALKAVYREAFMSEIGYNLAVKLLFVFLLVMCSVYQAMGIGHRFVKRQENEGIVPPEELDRVTRRLKAANWCILSLALIGFWLGLRLQS